MTIEATVKRKNAAVNGSNDRRRTFAVPAVPQSIEAATIARSALVRDDIWR